MGENERWTAQQPASGLLPNGLLPNEAASVIQSLDSERWAKAEERTAQLIACIQPNQPSDDRRNAVADYVQRLIRNCFPCQVFTFGSVPLKTYLPDGDIDLTAFSNQNLKDTWAHQVRDMLESEEKNENAEFRVKEVQYIQAEVKIIKCLVENIVVDISFNQLGGLCTLCFLEEVDNLINQRHLFKRSIILIKAWCYYESRILGAHHGLISTYALETLVLYIFHVFNNSFTGPLEVLYRFLEFFSKFDWDNFCVSLWGPVPISSLPDVTAEPPRKDGGELLLSKPFLEACSAVYAVFPPEAQGQPFVSKHFNVIDPLRINNNLGRSVSKGNFFRIRSAFAFGAKRLARLLDCPKEDIYFEVNQFFMNTWERHGSGHRPDAPANDLQQLRLSDPDHSHGSENVRSNSGSRTLGCEGQDDAGHGSRGVPFLHSNNRIESLSRSSETSTVSCTQNQKTYVNPNNTKISDQTKRETGSNLGAVADKSQRSSKPDNWVSDFQGRNLFARTRSSPELTDTYGEASRGRRDGASESGKGQTSSARLDNSRRKNLESDNLASHGVRSSINDPSSGKHTASHPTRDVATDSNSVSNSYQDDSSLVAMSEEFASVLGAQGMHQEEQDLVNMMASSTGLGFNGQIHVPLNLASSHIPLPIPPSVLVSMGYGQRNMAGIVPNIPVLETPWGTDMQFPQGSVFSQLTHYFSGMGLASNPENSIDPGNENSGHVEMNPGEADHDFWHDQERGSTGEFDLDNGNLEMHESDDKQQSTSTSHNFIPQTQIGGAGSSSRFQQKFTKETRGSMREDHIDTFPYQDNRGTDVYFDDRMASSRSSSGVHSSSLRSRTSSESSWEGSSVKVSRSTREKRGRKMASSAVLSAVYSKGKSVSEHSSSQADDDAKDGSHLSSKGHEITERIITPQSTPVMHVSRNQVPGLEPVQTSGSESLIPIAPVILGPGSQQKSADNSVLPFAFYPTGPPVPFFTMLPVYNFPTETGASDASTSQFSGEEGPDNSDTSQNFDSTEGLHQPEVLSALNSGRRADSAEPLEHKSDILNSDFASHWQNLQYGRFCQNSHSPAPLIYPSPVMVPPVYFQGRAPWDGPGRPPSTNMNLVTQIMGYGPHLVPVAPMQTTSNRSAGVYQQYVEEMPRYRGGTGTYLPNPKASVRDRLFTNARKGTYHDDRNDHYGDREGNYNINSKTRAPGRSHSRSHADKSSSRMDPLAANGSRADRTWGSNRHASFPSHLSQNGPIRSNLSDGGSTNVAYGMYSLPPINPSAVSSNGPTLPSVVMLYPYDHNAGYGSPAEQLEFGSLGPVGFSGINEISHLSEGSRLVGGYEDQRFLGSSPQLSSPDQPSSPRLQR